jgi:hypothetical protein
MSKLTDMAVKYDVIQDLPLANLADIYDDDDDNEPTLIMVRPPVGCEEKTYPGVGLLLALGTGIIFWSVVCGMIFR